MKKYDVWKKNGSDLMPIYEFSPAKSWSSEKVKEEKDIVLRKIESTLSGTITTKCDWLKIFSSLPMGLRKIVVSELLLGNSIVSIGKSEWPNPKSIVINLEDRFHENSRNLIATAKWRLLDDPHYCREEISEIEGKTEHLIIA
jgi:hypothetical protein